METPEAALLQGEVNRAEEIDRALIEKQFREMPSSEINLLASNLARPDGFAKSLITGSLASSRELGVLYGFAKTHRGSYLRNTDPFSRNDYISLNVGKAQRQYAESTERQRAKSDAEWEGGLGFVFPAEGLIQPDNVKVGGGTFNVHDAIDRVKEADTYEPRFESYSHSDTITVDEKTPKPEFLNLIHLARKAGDLHLGGWQAEVRIVKDRAGKSPRVNLKEAIILIPLKSKDAFVRYLDKKIEEVQRYVVPLKTKFGIDVSDISAADILSQYPNIYWYPQQNIELAIEYLSTHKEWRPEKEV